jgi:hypothetical protein
MTGNQHDYRWLRRPRPTARVLAFFACSRVPAPCGPRRGPPRLPRILNVRLDMAWDPGEHRHRLPWRDTDYCLPEGQTRRHSPTKFFGAQHLQGRLHPFPLHLACCCVPTHRRARCRSRRKARYWARGSRLPRWDLHPLDYATLPSRTVPYSALFRVPYSATA